MDDTEQSKAEWLKSELKNLRLRIFDAHAIWEAMDETEQQQVDRYYKRMLKRVHTVLVHDQDVEIPQLKFQGLQQCVQRLERASELRSSEVDKMESEFHRLARAFNEKNPIPSNHYSIDETKLTASLQSTLARDGLV